MARDIPLSIRLILLGVSGPIVSLALYLMFASMASVRLEKRATLQLASMFNNDLRQNLSLSTRIIQNSAKRLSHRLQQDSLELQQSLRDLRQTDTGTLQWKHKPLNPALAAEKLNALLRRSLSDPGERAGIYYRKSNGHWYRLTGISNGGQPQPMDWKVPDALVREIDLLFRDKSGTAVPRNTLIESNGDWRVARLTPLHPGERDQNLMLMVNVSSTAVYGLMSAGSSLFPVKNHSLAFYGLTPAGTLACSYQRPTSDTCRSLEAIMRRTGGIPRPTGDSANMIERAVTTTEPATGMSNRDTLFISTFPTWNWLAAILVDDDALTDSLVPLKRVTTSILLQLVGVTLLLISVCAVAAWRIARGIHQQLRGLAAAANAISTGESLEPLNYQGNDALGRLVKAFNVMACAVAAREDNLRAQIRQLEIDINATELQGQVCSILDNPSFRSLNSRARAMRERRRNFMPPTGSEPLAKSIENSGQP